MAVPVAVVVVVRLMDMNVFVTMMAVMMLRVLVLMPPRSRGRSAKHDKQHRQNRL